jgi:hypothetical protein
MALVLPTIVPTMKRFLFCLALASSCVFSHSSVAAEPLRVFIRSGPKSHGPGAHDHPSFLRDWVPLLNERGAKATGGDAFPTKAQLDATDVLILHLDSGGDIKIGTEGPDGVFAARWWHRDDPRGIGVQGP